MIRSQSRVSRDPEGGRRVKGEYLDTDKIYRMERYKVVKFSVSGSKTCGILLKSPEQFRGVR